jgi:hypothetical protein
MTINLQNLLTNNSKCKLVNIVWIERGILLSLVYYIIKDYNNLLNKTIILDVKRYQYFLKTLFPDLKFSQFSKHNAKNFYFNIRKINKYQNIVIDYLNNYNDFIYTEKIHLVPWYDMNDILIIYKINKKKKCYVDNYKNFIVNFSSCQRGNYNDNIWDFVMESKILQKYVMFNTRYTLDNIFKLLNKFVLNNYTNTTNTNTYFIPIENPKIYYKNKNTLKKTEIQNDKIDSNNDEKYKDIINNLEIKNDDNINYLISLLNSNIQLITNNI